MLCGIIFTTITKLFIFLKLVKKSLEAEIFHQVLDERFSGEIKVFVLGVGASMIFIMTTFFLLAKAVAMMQIIYRFFAEHAISVKVQR